MDRMRWIGVLSLAVVGCEDPKLQETPVLPGSVLSGVMTSDYVEDPGPTIVELSLEEDPVPPEGVGFAFTYTASAPEEWLPDDAGSLTAPFVFDGLQPGEYAVRAIMDNDRNYHPDVRALSNPSCGDRVGWHRDGAAGTGEVAPIVVDDNVRVDNVLVGPLALITEPNPVFTVDGDRTLRPQGTYRIEARGLNADFGTDLEKIVEGPSSSDPCRASFPYIRRDRDLDGELDGSPFFDLPLLDDVWPLFIVDYLGDPVDTLGDQVPDDFIRNDEFADQYIFIIAIAVPVTAAGEQFGTGSAPSLPPLNEQLDWPLLQMQLTELAFRVEDNGDYVIVEYGDLPAGAYGVRLVTDQGQVWRVPNEIDARLAMSRNLPPPGLTQGAAAHQGVYLTKPPN